MNRTMIGLLVVIVLLVGVVAFLLGQRNGEPEDAEPARDETVIVSSDDANGEEPLQDHTAAAPRALAVRIGRDGPHASACDRIGRVANLPGGSDDFLAVREAPSTDATRIDQLEDDAPFFVCDRQGPWYGIVYLSDGTLGEHFPVSLPRPRDRSEMNNNEQFKALRAQVLGTTEGNVSGAAPATGGMAAPMNADPAP